MTETLRKLKEKYNIESSIHFITATTKRLVFEDDIRDLETELDATFKWLIALNNEVELTFKKNGMISKV